MLLELAAEHILPVLVAEVGNYALRQVTGGAAPPACRCPTQWRPKAAKVASRAVHAVPVVTLVSQVPERVPLQVAGLRGDSHRAAWVEESLRRLAGVSSASVNALTGSVLVQYDPRRVAVTQIQARLEPPRHAPRRRATLQRPASGAWQLALVGV